MPSTAEEWRDVAQERGADARALADQRRFLAAVYMLGYVIECNLKAYLNALGKEPPTHGKAGHNLTGLWEAAGWKGHDLTGPSKWFVQAWSTSLRYETALSTDFDFQSLFEAGMRLAGSIQSRMRWTRGRRR